MGAIDFVAASAGSGKTWRVVTAVVEAVTQDALRPEQLVATTFSRRAATALQEALDARLRAAGRSDDALALAHARIGTVHALCATLLHDFAFTLGRPTGLRIVEPAASDALLAETLGALVSPAELARIDDLRARLSDLDVLRDAGEAVSLARAHGLDAPALRAMLPASAGSLEQLLGPPAAAGDLETALDGALETVGTRGGAPIVREAREARARGAALPWSLWLRLSTLAVGADDDALVHPLRKAAAGHRAHPALRADLRAAIELVSALAARAVEPFDAARRRAGVVDYLDLETLALALLRRPDVRSALDGAFGLVVVDEFQDSSPLQLALFLELATLAPRSLWVGDLKQSIFGFRGADPDLVARVISAATAARPPETLARSWRSRAPLVDLASGLFAPPFAAHGLPETQVRLTAAHLDVPALGAALERWCLPEERARQPVAIARGVRALLDDAAVRVRDPRDGGVRRPVASDVAVLARTHARCHAVAQALSALGLPCDYARAGLLATPEVRLVLAAARVLTDPDDQLAQAEIVRLSADLPDDDRWLRALFGDGPALRDHDRVAALRSSHRDGVLPLDALDQAALGHGLATHVARWPAPAQRAANLAALRALAVGWTEQRQAEGRPVAMSALLAWLRDRAARGDDLCGRTHGAAVAVLTWHAAKGLEWPVVALADLDDGLDDATVLGARAYATDATLRLDDVLAGRALRYWPSPYGRGEEGTFAGMALRSDAASKNLREAATRESLRLLYVAWTRARDRVCLAAPAGRLTAGLVGLLQREGVPLVQEPRLGRARWLRREWAVVERTLSGKALSVPAGSAAPGTVAVPDVAPRMEGPRPALWMQPSALAEAGVVVRAVVLGPAHVPRGGFDPQRVGTMLHAWFAGTVGRAGASAPEHARAAEFLTAFGAEHTLDAAALVAMATALRGWIAATTADAGAGAGATVLPELPVWQARPDGSLLRGTADLVLVTPRGIVVVDHKSHRGGADGDARAAVHWGQLRAYGEALAQALGRPVVEHWVHLPLAGRIVLLAGPDNGGAGAEGGAVTTAYHAKYWAHALELERAQDDAAGLSRSIANARVDLNPHQIEAALFALRSPLSRGVLLADEVGLGKTIEAGIVLAQKWAERRRRVLLVTPATLRKQWQNELASKFFIPSVIVETKTITDAKKRGEGDPLRRGDAVVIVSYEFVYNRAAEIKSVAWDLVVCDEAHRLRNIYKGTRKAAAIVDAVRERKKLLLTATPLQNNLLELFGLVGVLDDQLFGSQEAFVAQYVRQDDEAERNGLLRDRVRTVCHRTLRRQVLEYIRFTERRALTLHFTPSEAEQALYVKVSDYLQREVLVALPTRQRRLITMVLRKLLASSSRAIGATLTKFVDRLKALRGDAPTTPTTPEATATPEAPDPSLALAQDYEALGETAEEWDADADDPSVQSAFGKSDPTLPNEIDDLRGYITLAASIGEDQKTLSLHAGLAEAFARAAALGARRKAVVFTESVKTQEYLVAWLGSHGYAGKIVVMNGTNTDAMSRGIYEQWKARHAARWKDVSSGSRTADMKAAIVEAFQGDEVEVLVATESAAEGINLQFCSIVVNYDLPWNPQRVEQRIGRCHRYGQQHDVIVVNFVNAKNEADQRVYQLLDQKFRLFDGIFGASDDILGTIESGIDVEQAIADLYQTCRTREQIVAGFDALQASVEAKIRAALADTRQKVLDHLDEDVQERLRVHRDKAKESLAEHERLLLDLCRHELGARATFAGDEPRFSVRLADGSERCFNLRWPVAEQRGEEFLRSNHEFALALIAQARARPTPSAGVTFAYASHAASLEPYRGRAGWLRLERFSTEALDRRESVLLLAAVCDDGEVLPGDLSARLFSLGVTQTAGADGEAPAALGAEVARLRVAHREVAGRRDQQYLNEEEVKLDTRVEDIRLGLEAEIKGMDKEVSALRRASKQAKSLAEKLEVQRRIRALEEKRDEKFRKLYDEVKRYRGEQDQYIKALESQAKARTEDAATVFVLRWTLV